MTYFYIALGVIFVYCTASFCIVSCMFSLSFKRMDRAKYTVYPHYEDFDLMKKPISFKSGKNTLNGYIFGENNHKGLVVLGHGLGGCHEDYLNEIALFVKNGWRVFAYDNTGSNKSGGKNVRGLQQSAIDMHAALTYIENSEELKSLPATLYGHSWGGYAVTAVLNYGHEVKAVVSIAAYNKPIEIIYEQWLKKVGKFAFLFYPFLSFAMWLRFGKYAKMTAVEGINKSAANILIIQGKKDPLIKYDTSSVYAKRSKITNSKASYKLYEDRGHNNSFLSENAVEYGKTIQSEYKSLKDKFKGKIPDEENKIFFGRVDRTLMNELNVQFFEEINDFFTDALKS